MSRYGKCYGCARKEDCSFLTDAKQALAGHGRLITSVRINCGKIYESDFKPGERVRVKVPSDFGQASMYGLVSDKAHTWLTGSQGTVLSWSKNGKVNVLFDPEEEGDPYLIFGGDEYHPDMEWCRLQSLQHRDIIRIDEPSRTICEHCTTPFDEKGKPETWQGKNGQAGGCQDYDAAFCAAPKATGGAS